jgi:hypothetical protein
MTQLRPRRSVRLLALGTAKARTLGVDGAMLEIDLTPFPE